MDYMVLRAMGIADELGLDIESRDYFHIILPLLLIPLMGLVIVRLHRFSDIMKKKEKEAAPEKLIKSEEKPKEKPKEEKKPRMVEKGGDEGKFLEKELEEAEREFRKKLG